LDSIPILGTAADAQVQLQLNVNGAAYCTLAFTPGMIVATSVAGTTLPPLASGAQLTLSVLSVGTVNPGADLTVLVRL